MTLYLSLIRLFLFGGKVKTEQLIFNNIGQTIIPEGYKWCHGCEALTPYTPDNTFLGSYRCAICDNYSTGMIECPKCGCEESEDCTETTEVIRHRDGCHDEDDPDEDWNLYTHADIVLREFRSDFMRPCPDRGSYCLPDDQVWYNENRRLNGLLRDHKKRTECGCPRFTIYRNINQIVLDSGSCGTQDGTSYWWEYKVRCRVCGFVYENGDST